MALSIRRIVAVVRGPEGGRSGHRDFHRTSRTGPDQCLSSRPDTCRSKRSPSTLRAWLGLISTPRRRWRALRRRCPARRGRVANTAAPPQRPRGPSCWNGHGAISRGPSRHHGRASDGMARAGRPEWATVTAGMPRRQNSTTGIGGRGRAVAAAMTARVLSPANVTTTPETPAWPARLRFHQPGRNCEATRFTCRQSQNACRQSCAHKTSFSIAVTPSSPTPRARCSTDRRRSPDG